MSDNRAQHWLKLDNAAKIYPAAKRRDWTALFRFSAQLDHEIDPVLLEQAQKRTLLRFPSFALKLKSGFFWYYLEHNYGAPDIQPDVGNPCVRIDPKQNKGFLFRVRYYNNRVALEVYHVLSDGGGGISFFKTLLAEYLELRYGGKIPRDAEILDCNDEPVLEEMEDAYLRYAGNISKSRREDDAYYLKGTREPADIIHITTGMMPVAEVLNHAAEKSASLTVYLTAAMLMALDKIQREQVKPSRLMPLKICVPVDLRRFYPTRSKRNFAIFVNPGIEPKYGQFDFDEVIKIVHHQMGLEITEKRLNSVFTKNVQSEQSKVLRLMPLFIKNWGMRMVFSRVGDRKTSTCISNLGRVELPDEMSKHVQRLDLILGPLSRNRVVCGVLSYRGQLVFNFTRTIKESWLEKEFFRFLVRQGIPVKIESNQLSQVKNG